jgi:uncharacterized protein (TIGR03435 family)
MTISKEFCSWSSTVFASCCLVISVSTLAGQQPSFEVASVRESQGPNGGWTYSPSGEVRFASVPLRTIITVAYDIPLSLEQVKFVGGSSQILATRFTIDAKGTPPQNRLPMLRTLLAERFGLRTHTEVRTMPIMALTRRDRLGPYLKPSPHNCFDLLAREAAEKQKLELATEHCRSAQIPPRFGLPVKHWSGPIKDLISRDTQPFVERPVVDMTGLEGNFEWVVAFVPLDAPRADVPNIMTAFEDQLGLKLEPRMGPYEVIVIDDVRMPTPD